MAELFHPVDVEVGNELFWYIFKGEPMPKNGFIDLDENTLVLGRTVDEQALSKFKVTEKNRSRRSGSLIRVLFGGVRLLTSRLASTFAPPRRQSGPLPALSLL
jgi:hypothetical protein